MGLKEVKSALLKKGWAGRTLSREETVERLNPLIKQHMALNHTHTYVINTCSEQDIAQAPAPSWRRVAPSPSPSSRSFCAARSIASSPK